MNDKNSIITSFLQFGTNKNCFLCNGSKESSFACVNHGIFICSECADLLNNNENLCIKAIDSPESWTDKEIQSLSFGGNNKFDEFLSPYLEYLNKTKNQVNVFNLSATEYYRKRLDSFVNHGYFSHPPPKIDDGCLLNCFDSEMLSEIEIESNINENVEKYEEQKLLQSKNQTKTQKLGESIKDTFNTTGEIIQEKSKSAWNSTAGVRESISTAAGNAYDGAGDFTKNTWEKTKDISSSAWSNTSSFFSYIGGKTSEVADDAKGTYAYKSGAHKVSTMKQLASIFGWTKPNESEIQIIEEFKDDQSQSDH